MSPQSTKFHSEPCHSPQMANAMPCGPDPELIANEIRTFIDAGFDHVYVHQVGPDSQLDFLRFFAREVMPGLRATARAA